MLNQVSPALSIGWHWRSRNASCSASESRAPPFSWISFVRASSLPHNPPNNLSQIDHSPCRFHLPYNHLSIARYLTPARRNNDARNPLDRCKQLQEVSNGEDAY